METATSSGTEQPPSDPWSYGERLKIGQGQNKHFRRADQEGDHVVNDEQDFIIGAQKEV